MMSNIENNIIEVKGLKVYFDIRRGFLEEILTKEKRQVKAVDGIDLNIKKGEIVSLVGESGSGKTTIGKAILHLVEKTEGNIFFKDTEIDEKNNKEMRLFRQKAQMIFQDPYQSLNPRDIIIDIISEPLEVNRLIKTEAEKRERVIRALEWAGLKPAEDYLYRYPHELSGGQRQRVAIAGALVLEPEFIVADEPVSMLDVSIRADILRLMLDQCNQKGISYLFITHDLSLAWLISDRIATVYLGKIVEIGDARLIVGKSVHPYTKALVSVMPVPKVRKDRKMTILEGETPNPINIPQGCRFHPRCPNVMEKCRESEPELIEIEPGHFAACHLCSHN